MCIRDRFLFLGPTGVGKTETAKAITAELFGSEDSIMRFDMSNYQSQADIPQLIGSSETSEPGQMTEAVRSHHYGTLLLDELEKAHRDLLNIFLTVLDEGYFTCLLYTSTCIARSLAVFPAFSYKTSPCGLTSSTSVSYTHLLLLVATIGKSSY